MLVVVVALLAGGALWVATDQPAFWDGPESTALPFEATGQRHEGSTDAAGATLSVDDPNDPADGVRVRVPTGAVSQPTPLSVSAARLDDD